MEGGSCFRDHNGRCEPLLHRLVQHPQVADYVRKCQAAGKKPDVEGLGDMGRDSSFLNDIQKVDPTLHALRLMLFYFVLFYFVLFCFIFFFSLSGAHLWLRA